MKKGQGGLESQQQQQDSSRMGMGSNMGQKAGSTMEDIKNKAKETLNK
jgi:hypothetical protein